MDKRRKTPWEKKMLRWKIALMILIPLVFGLAFWFLARRNPLGP
jgi:hypothetical protein